MTATIDEDFRMAKDKHDFLLNMDQHVKNVDIMTLTCEELEKKLQRLQERIEELKEEDEQLDEELKILREGIFTVPDNRVNKNGLLAPLFDSAEQLRYMQKWSEKARAEFLKGNLAMTARLLSPDTLTAFQSTMAELKGGASRQFRAWQAEVGRQEKKSRD